MSVWPSLLEVVTNILFDFYFATTINKSHGFDVTNIICLQRFYSRSKRVVATASLFLYPDTLAGARCGWLSSTPTGLDELDTGQGSSYEQLLPVQRLAGLLFVQRRRCQLSCSCCRGCGGAAFPSTSKPTLQESWNPSLMAVEAASSGTVQRKRGAGGRRGTSEEVFIKKEGGEKRRWWRSIARYGDASGRWVNEWVLIFIIV